MKRRARFFWGLHIVRHHVPTPSPFWCRELVNELSRMTLGCSRQLFQQFWGENAPNLCDKLGGRKGCPNIQRLSKEGQEFLDTPGKINSFGSCWVESGEKKEPRHPSGKTSEDGCKTWRRQRETHACWNFMEFSQQECGAWCTPLLPL